MALIWFFKTGKETTVMLDFVEKTFDQMTFLLRNAGSRYYWTISPICGKVADKRRNQHGLPIARACHLALFQNRYDNTRRSGA